MTTIKKESWEEEFDKAVKDGILTYMSYGCDGADECCGCCGGDLFSESLTKDFIRKVRADAIRAERERSENDVEEWKNACKDAIADKIVEVDAAYQRGKKEATERAASIVEKGKVPLRDMEQSMISISSHDEIIDMLAKAILDDNQK